MAVAAAPDGLVFLDRAGVLQQVDDDGQIRRLAPAWGPLAYLRDTDTNYINIRLVVDVAADRVILIERGRTWAVHGGMWVRLAEQPPGLGWPPLACATPRGVYLLGGRDLWLLGEQEWQPVGRAGPGWRASLMWWSPLQDGLWLLSDDAIEVWGDSGPRPVPAPPLPASRRDNRQQYAWETLVSAGYDPVSNVLLWHMDHGYTQPPGPAWPPAVTADQRTRILDLSECALPAATLPEPSPQARAVLSRSAAEDEPKSSFYLLESSIMLDGEYEGFLRVTVDRDEIRRLLVDEPGEDGINLLRDWYTMLPQGQTACLWTVQAGVLTAGLDLAPYLLIRYPDGTTRTGGEIRQDATTNGNSDRFAHTRDDRVRFSVDWPAISARLPALRPPLAPLDKDQALEVRVPEPHPAPDIDTYLDVDVDLLWYGVNGL